MADTITLNWTGDTSVIALRDSKGLDVPENISLFPEITNKFLDGTSENQFMTYIKNFYIKTVILTSQQIDDIIDWAFDTSRTIDFSIEGVSANAIPITLPSTVIEFQREDGFRKAVYWETTFNKSTTA